MKQPSLLSALFAPGPAAAPVSRARESDSDAFARALESTRPVPSERTAPQSRQGASTEAGRRTEPERNNVRPTPAESRRESPLAPPKPRDDAVKEVSATPPDTTDSSSVETSEAGKAGEKVSPLIAETPLPDSLLALEQQGIPAPLGEVLMADIAHLMEQLQQGVIDENEALATLQNLLQEQGLSSLFQDIEQQLQHLAGPSQHAKEGGESALLAMLASLQQQLVDRPRSGNGKIAVGTQSPTGIVVGEANIAASMPQSRHTENRSESARPLVAVAPPADSSGERTRSPLTTQSSPAVDAENATTVTLKDSLKDALRTSVGEGDMLSPKNAATVTADHKLASLASALAQAQTASAERGASVNASAALGITPPAAAPVPTERGFTVQTMVNTLVGQPNWGQAVSQRVMWLAQQNISEAQLRLDPPDLGPVSVKISVQNDQAQVVFTSHSPGVREALDQSSQRLRELFAEQGLDLVNVDVSDHQQRRGQETTEQGGQRGTQGSGTETDSGDAPQWIMEGQLTLVDHYA